MAYDELKELMVQSGSLTVGKGATEFEIQEAQQALGLLIQGDYRSFLLDFGWGGAGDFERMRSPPCWRRCGIRWSWG